MLLLLLLLRTLVFDGNGANLSSIFSFHKKRRGVAILSFFSSAFLDSFDQILLSKPCFFFGRIPSTLRGAFFSPSSCVYTCAVID